MVVVASSKAGIWMSEDGCSRDAIRSVALADINRDRRIVDSTV